MVKCSEENQKNLKGEHRILKFYAKEFMKKKILSVFLFLATDDFWRDYNDMLSKNIEFVREPKEQEYGTVAVFKDLYGNLWDLVQFAEGHPASVHVK